MAGSKEPRRGPWPRLERVEAICYSGYRDGQRPGHGLPTKAQVLEDLRLLAGRGFRHLRLYDASPHAEVVLETIKQHSLPFVVMLAAYLEAEESNPHCPWGGVYPEATLAKNRVANDEQVARVIALAQRYPQLVSSVSAGNEATVEWTDHLVPVARVIEQVKRLKKTLSAPITFCDNYVPWQDKLAPLAAEVDFISLHTYPVWEHQGLDTALAFTEANFTSVSSRYPSKKVVITEAGWPTASNGRGIPVGMAGEAQQLTYLELLSTWSRNKGILTFLFEAFDEAWKGSDHADEPEKHWGLFFADRQPKLVAKDGHLFSAPSPP